MTPFDFISSWGKGSLGLQPGNAANTQDPTKRTLGLLAQFKLGFAAMNRFNHRHSSAQ